MRIYFERDEWGAQYGRGGLLQLPVSHIVIHHFLIPHVAAGESLEREQRVMRSVEKYHAEEKGWSGIGYNFIITQNGHVYEGRGFRHQGAHAGRSMNARSLGLAFSINGSEHALSPAAIEACRGLITAAIRQDVLTPEFQITGHRDHMDRSCPGDRVYDVLDDLAP